MHPSHTPQRTTPEQKLGYVTDMRKYHKAGKCSMDYKILGFMFKNI